jgi:hypothetical protein
VFDLGVEPLFGGFGGVAHDAGYLLEFFCGHCGRLFRRMWRALGPIISLPYTPALELLQDLGADPFERGLAVSG